MSINIKPRHIRILRELLPISQMMDEEIVKAAMDRLQSKAVMLVYEDQNMGMLFLGRHKKDSILILRQLILAWEGKFGKWKKLDNEED